jgi:4-amino-4-deoxy-L-arabinose transferase-like glycosyltransferase
VRRWVALVVGLELIPFLWRPFHMDDPFWVWTARQIHSHPLDFYGYRANWFGTQQWMHEITKTPPLFSYVLALGGALLGWSETALHLIALPLSLLFALWTYRLAKNVGSDPLLTAAVAVTTPVFVLSGVSLMCDTMMAALWVGSFAIWIEAHAREKKSLYALAAVLCGLSCLTKYNGVTLVPVLLLYTVLRVGRVNVRCLYMLIPIVMLGAYRWGAQALYGHDVVAQTVGFTLAKRAFSLSTLPAKTASGLAFMGGTLAPLFFFAPWLWSRKAWVGWALLFGGMAWGHTADSWSLRLQWALWALVGIQFLSLSVVDALHRRDAFSWCLLAWVWCTFFFATYLNWAVTGRAFVLLAPALGLLIARRCHDLFKTGASSRWKAGLPLAVSLVFTLCLARADLAQAQSVRNGVRFVLEQYPPRQNTVWFQGHWGFQYYMETGGAHAMDTLHSRLKTGDILVVPLNNVNLRNWSDLELLGRLEGPVGSRIAVMNSDERAGYYADAFGALPFRLFVSPLEKVLVYRLNPAV